VRMVPNTEYWCRCPSRRELGLFRSHRSIKCRRDGFGKLKGTAGALFGFSHRLPNKEPTSRSQQWQAPQSANLFCGEAFYRCQECRLSYPFWRRQAVFAGIGGEGCAPRNRSQFSARQGRPRHRVFTDA
jgi:hypothetical protein